MPRCVIALSGGIDSAVLLAHNLKLYESFPEHNRPSILCVGFNYGSKHNDYEISAAKNIASYYRIKYGVVYSTIDARSLFGAIDSNLLHGEGKIPEGHYEDESMKQTVVPGRNMIFASILAGIAASGPEEQWMKDKLFHGSVEMGIHAGDHSIYADCRPAFFNAMRMTMELATNTQPEGKLTCGVEFGAPFLYKKKDEIVQLGIQLKVPFELTRTCYKNQSIACGKCGSCQERLQAFNLNRMEDPIEYESRVILPKNS